MSRKDSKLVKFHVWTKLRFSSEPQMLPRFALSAASFGTKLLLFGGNNGHDTNDTWEYNLGDRRKQSFALATCALCLIYAFHVHAQRATLGTTLQRRARSHLLDSLIAPCFTTIACKPSCAYN